MRPEPKATDRRVRTRRAPAVLLGLSLAVGAAASALAHAEPEAPATAPGTAAAAVVCEIALDAIPGGTRIEGRVTADHAIAGSYAMQITSRSGGGRSSIRQAGDFAAPAGRTTALGETELFGSPASHAVALTLTIGGQRLSCADPAL